MRVTKSPHSPNRIFLVRKGYGREKMATSTAVIVLGLNNNKHDFEQVTNSLKYVVADTSPLFIVLQLDQYLQHVPLCSTGPKPEASVTYVTGTILNERLTCTVILRFGR